MSIQPEFLIFCSHCKSPCDICKVEFVHGYIANSLSHLPDHDDKRWKCPHCDCINAPDDFEFEEALEHNGDGEEVF